MELEDETEAPREEFKPKVVGRGLRAEFENPEDQQWYLADSEHPYAPFPGNALKWESFVYDDGTSFEGLAREYIPHGKGVMVFGTGTGAGIQLVEPGDRYEGEFNAGFANGLGTYTGASGEVYRGEWLYGKRHGCGAITSFAPYFRELKKGTSPENAWKRTRSAILNKRMRYGRWDRNKLVKDVSDDRDDICRVSDIKGMLQEMESVVTKSRWFQHKPDGDATHLNMRDGNGVPVPVFQDPLHYPHGTKFLAPGPLGQCHPVPPDQRLRSEMRKHARNYMRVYNQYNLPYLARPGDDLFAAARLHQIQQLQQEHYSRIAAGEDEETVFQQLEESLRKAAFPEPLPPTSRPLPRQEAQAQRTSSPAAPESRAATREDSDDEVDDSDLLASASDAGTTGGEQPPTLFCSMAVTSRRAGRALHAVASFSATQLLPRVMRRQPLSQPLQARPRPPGRRQPA